MGGLFITVEGPEGAGKTTVMNVVNELLIAAGYETVTTREPGGIKISEKIREIILDKDHKEMDSLTEALLYAAARRQHLIEKVRPALASGKIVLCDRFIDSSIAYQGYARGIGMDEVSQINELAVEGYMPDLTIFFDIEPELGLARIAANGSREVNRLDLEGLEFHHKVYKGYEIQANKYPERIKRVDATLSIEELAEQIKDMIVSKFEEVNAVSV